MAKTRMPRGRRALAAAMAGMMLLAQAPAVALADAGGASATTVMNFEYAGWDGNLSVTVPTELPLYADAGGGDFIAPTNLRITNGGGDCVYVRRVRATMGGGFVAVAGEEEAEEELERSDKARPFWLTVSQAGNDGTAARFTLKEASAKAEGDKGAVTGKTLENEGWVIAPDFLGEGTSLLAAAGALPAGTAARLVPGAASLACSLDWEFALSATDKYLTASDVGSLENLPGCSLAKLKAASAHLTKLYDRVREANPGLTHAELLALPAITSDPVYEVLKPLADGGTMWRIADFGTMTEVPIHLVGVLHDELATSETNAKGTGSYAGLTFLTGKVAATPDLMNNTALGDNNSVGWSGSIVRTNKLNKGGYTWKNLPEGLGADGVIRLVSKPTSRKRFDSNTGSTTAGESPTADLLWVPSYTEAGGTDLADDGEAYPWLADPVNRKTIRTSSEHSVWLRSPQSNNAGNFRAIGNNGALGVLGANNYGGVLVGFCI